MCLYIYTNIIDDVAYLDINNISGLNLYAYCNNNPIMYDDPEVNSEISTCYFESNMY